MPDVGQEPEVGSSCLFDFERGEVANCFETGENGQITVRRALLKDLTFNKFDLAAIHSHIGWLYVNRKGTVVISGVPDFENGADDFHDGLVRIVRQQKYGFVNVKGELVIPPIYDGAYPFQNGVAEVCLGCKSRCVAIDCEYHTFDGGRTLTVDTQGRVIPSADHISE